MWKCFGVCGIRAKVKLHLSAAHLHPSYLPLPGPADVWEVAVVQGSAMAGITAMQSQGAWMPYTVIH